MWMVHGFTTLAPVVCLSFPVSYTSGSFLYITSPACLHWLFGFLWTHLRVLVPALPLLPPKPCMVRLLSLWTLLWLRQCGGHC